MPFPKDSSKQKIPQNKTSNLHRKKLFYKLLDIWHFFIQNNKSHLFSAQKAWIVNTFNLNSFELLVFYLDLFF